MFGEWIYSFRGKFSSRLANRIPNFSIISGISITSCSISELFTTFDDDSVYDAYLFKEPLQLLIVGDIFFDL